MLTKLYKELSPAEIKKVLLDLYGNCVTVKECRPINGGNFNTIYYVKTDKDKNGLVLRAAPKDKHFLFSFHKDMMSAEPLFHKLLEEKEIPTVKVLKYAPENTVIEREYMITEYIPSVAMNNLSLKSPKFDYLYTEVGKYIKKLHTITNDKFGWKRPGSNQGEFDTWAQFVLAYMEEVADKSEEYGLFEYEYIQYLRELFNSKISLFYSVDSPNMIHKDLHEGNILVHQQDGQYKVAAILDLSWAIFGDHKWELLSRCMINKPFLDGYGKDMPQNHEFKEMSMLYKLLHGFFSAYVAMVEYGFKDWYEGEKRDVIALIREMKKAVS